MPRARTKCTAVPMQSRVSAYTRLGGERARGNPRNLHL